MRLRLFLILLFVTMLILNSCGGGGGGTPSSGESVTISGKVTYDRVPVNSNYYGLNYNNITQEPAKRVSIDAINSSNQSVASTTTDDSGNYSFTVPVNTQVKIRVSAKMLQQDIASWNVRVVDNTNSFSLYVMEGSLTSSGTADSQRNLNAPSGWDGSSYTSPRIAAPFAILDNIYDAIQKVLGANPQTVFPALQVNWSTNNVASASIDYPNGLIITSHYWDGDLYILGDADSDTDEYDDHIIAHEWGHYYEDKFSRSDSIGGSHSLDDILDIRVAFGEGWGNAFSAIALDDPIYFDTLGADQASGFNFDIESGTSSNNGWYSESSVQRILYDLYDSTDDGVDTLSLGFSPIHDVFTGSEKITSAFTSIFTFITALKNENVGDAGSIDTIVSTESIATINDIYGTGRTNLSAEYPYSDLIVGTPINICLSTVHGTYNKLSNRKYVKFTSSTSGSYTISVTRTSGDIGTDPDIYLYQSSPSFHYQDRAISTIPDTETKSFTMTAGTSYLLDIYDDKAIADTCYDVSVTLP